MLEGDPVHCLKDGVERKGDCRCNGANPSRPRLPARVNVKGEEQDDESRNEHRHAYELPEVNGGPVGAVGILAERGDVVIGIRPIGVEDTCQQGKEYPGD